MTFASVCQIGSTRKVLLGHLKESGQWVLTLNNFDMKLVRVKGIDRQRKQLLLYLLDLGLDFFIKLHNRGGV